MASLPPSEIPLDAPRGARPFAGQPGATDFGLQTSAQALAGYAQHKQQVDDKLDDDEAVKVMQQVRQAYEPGQAERQETFDWSQSGYADSELASLETAAKPFMDQASRPGVRNALSRHLDSYRADVGGRLVQIEAAKRAEPMREAREASEALTRSQSMASYVKSMADAEQEIRQSSDASLRGYMDRALSKHDEIAAGVIDATPERQRGAVAQALAAERTRLAASSMHAEEQARLADVADRTGATLNTLANGVLTDPGKFDAAASQIPAVIGALPGPLQVKAEREARAQLVSAKIEGLVNAGHEDQAKAELTSGKYDAFLTPEQMDRLNARVEAAQARGPRTFDEWLKAEAMGHQIDAEVEARATTGKGSGLSLQQITETLGPHAAAQAADRFATADRTFAAIGDVRDKPMALLLQQAAASPPDPSTPGYAQKLEAWRMGQQAAKTELDRRTKDPAAWAQQSLRPGDAQSMVSQRWQDFAGGGFQASAGTAYAADILGLQQRAGVNPSAQRILPADRASELVKAYNTAAPEQREASLKSIAALFSGLPPAISFRDGRIASPRGMLMRELDAAGLSKADVSAVVDLSDPRDQARFAVYAQAVNNPAAKAKLPGKGDEGALENAIAHRLAPFFATANALPGSAALNAARTERVTLVARHLVSQGKSVQAAAAAATADLAEGYRFTDGYRIPKGLGDDADAVRLIRNGVGEVTRHLVIQNGLVGSDMLRPALGNDGQPLPPKEGRMKASADVRDHGRWITREGDDGLILVKPDRAAGWTPVLDRYGRTFSMSWGELQSAGREQTWFHEPPPEQPGQGVTAINPAKAAEAMARAVTVKETGGHPNPTGAVSPKGALGTMQLMPGTAQRAAARLGIPYEKERLTTDAAYNQRLGREELRHLTEKYGGNVALVAAAYNAGEGNVDSWIKRFGDPRRGLTADAWVAAIPFAETRDYVRFVLPKAMGFLK